MLKNIVKTIKSDIGELIRELEKYEAYQDTGPTHDSLDNASTENIMKWLETKRKLMDYCQRFSLEQVQLIEAIMYAGRDNYTEEVIRDEDSDYDEEPPEKPRYIPLKEKIESMKGFGSDKNTYINHMLNKSPLPEYLASGLKYYQDEINRLVD